ncbi:MAG: hypothetical protein JW908_00735 [Anaerolineales bacterium]|nr:hypothetical protein [Anaerolineales bacterium]
MKRMHMYSWDHFKHDPDYEKKPVTRIELTEQVDGSVFVSKYKEGWTAGSYADESYTTDEQPFDDMVAWLNENGWNCKTWFDFERGKRCRAFSGKPMPVRTREEILRLRTMITTGEFKVPNGQVDLRYWY